MQACFPGGLLLPKTLRQVRDEHCPWKIPDARTGETELSTRMAGASRAQALQSSLEGEAAVAVWGFGGQPRRRLIYKKRLGITVYLRHLTLEITVFKKFHNHNVFPLELQVVTMG